MSQAKFQKSQVGEKDLICLCAPPPPPARLRVRSWERIYRDELTHGGTSFIYDDLMCALNGIHTWHEEAAMGIQNIF